MTLRMCGRERTYERLVARRSSRRRSTARRSRLPTVLMLRNPSVMHLDRSVRPGHAPMDRDDPARLPRSLGSGRVAADRPESRLVVGRMGQPGLPRAVHRPVDGRIGPHATSSSGSRSGRRRRASGVWRPTSSGSRSRTADSTQPALRGGSPPRPRSSSIGRSAGPSPSPTWRPIPTATRSWSRRRSARSLAAVSDRPRARSSRCCGCSTSCWPRPAVGSSRRRVLTWTRWVPRAVRPADLPGWSSPEASAGCGKVARGRE